MSVPRGISRLSAWLILISFGASACTPAGQGERTRPYTLVIGLDVSGSFRDSGHFNSALDFAAHYLYGHLTGQAEMEVPTALFVGSVGGTEPGQAQSFHPIHDFQGKSVAQIRDSLEEWFPKEDRLTDFNAFFSRVADLLQKRGLVLTPLNMVILSDGIPDLMTGTSAEERYAAIDVSPLEYLSRSVTVRVLYPDPTVAVQWEQNVTRRRVRLWTTDAAVMRGWRAQAEADTAEGTTDKLWTWIEDNVDFRVRRQRIL